MSDFYNDDEKTAEDWYEEAESWVEYGGPTDLAGIKEELADADDIDDIDTYARMLKYYIDQVIENQD